MKKTYEISGMTCQGCRKSVEDTLSAVNKVNHVIVDLESGHATIESESPISLSELIAVLPSKYTIKELQEIVPDMPAKKKSKLQTLKPLLIIFGYLLIASVLLNYKDWKIDQAMLDFMGLFYIVFSFFKVIDLSGFSNSFKMYDPIAKLIPAYGILYPFIETALGLLFLMRILLPIATVGTLLVLSITTFGVVKVLLNKKEIQCACLGSVFNLPMTEATFIENIIMIGMAIGMLIMGF